MSLFLLKDRLIYCLLLVLTWLSANVRDVMWRASLFEKPVGAGDAIIWAAGGREGGCYYGEGAAGGGG